MKKIIKKLILIIKLFLAILYLIHSRIFIKKRKGVAQVLESYKAGGLEQVATNIYKGYLKNGDGSFVISLSNNLGEMCQQLESPAHLRITHYSIIDFIYFCAKNNIRTLIFHYTTYRFVFLKLLGFKNYYIIHNTYLWYTKGEWNKLIFKLKFSNGNIAVSDWCKSYFIKKTKITNVQTILNGIDFENIKNGEKTSITREKLGIKKNDKVVLTIAAYTPGKYQVSLIGIMEEILKYRSDIKFVCVGHILEKKYYDYFIKNLAKSPASKNIIPLTYIPQNEIGSFIQEIADAYLQPSVHEAGVPLTVMEALLNNKPVIMTDFMVEKTFPNINGIIPVDPPYEDIMNITPKEANLISKKVKNINTIQFANSIIETINNLDVIIKKMKKTDFSFLSKETMQKKYLKYIKF